MTAMLENVRAKAAEGGLTLDVDMRVRSWRPLHDDLTTQAGHVWQQLGLPAAEACLVLADDALLAELNARYRGKQGPTNVLSFPAHDFAAPVAAAADLPVGAVLGDVVMSFERLAAEAEAGGLAPAAHARHLLTHGLLHLLGHDHQDDAEAAVMEGLESRLMLAAGLADPYAAHPEAGR